MNEQENRCQSTRPVRPLATLGIPKSFLDGEAPTTPVRCRGDEGHDGDHYAWVQPFPGFADQRVSWSGE